MITWLVNRKIAKMHTSDQNVLRYGVSRLLGWCGIFLNIFLFLSKYFIGVMVNSVSIRADAINNLTDSLSNIISIISFKLAEKPADKEHPYGHERTETIAALVVGIIIIYLGIDLVKESIQKILHPAAVHFEWSAIGVLVLSIAIKFYMYLYNRKYAKIYNSELLEAVSLDSRNDMLGTSLVLLSTFLSPLIGFDLDGWMGIVVSGIIFYSAWGLLKDVVNILLGEAPSPETTNRIIDIILLSPIAIDVHDIAIHNYGPKYKYATAHVEVDGTLNLMDVHNEVDRIEREVMKEMGIELVTHVDPVLLHDEATNAAEDEVIKIIQGINPVWELQDFRLEHTNHHHRILFFDLIVPYNEHRSCDEIQDLIQKKMSDCDTCHIEMRIVHPYS